MTRGKGLRSSKAWALICGVCVNIHSTASFTLPAWHHWRWGGKRRAWSACRRHQELLQASVQTVARMDHIKEGARKQWALSEGHRNLSILDLLNMAANTCSSQCRHRRRLHAVDALNKNQSQRGWGRRPQNRLLALPIWGWLYAFVLGLMSVRWGRVPCLPPIIVKQLNELLLWSIGSAWQSFRGCTVSPQDPSAEVSTPSISECNHIWRQGL